MLGTSPPPTTAYEVGLAMLGLVQLSAHEVLVASKQKQSRNCNCNGPVQSKLTAYSLLTLTLPLSTEFCI